MVECPEGLGEDPEHWVARRWSSSPARGQRVEWKTYGDDEPADLPERLVRAGFVRRRPRGRAARPVRRPRARRRPARGHPDARDQVDEDWERVRASVDPVWGKDTSWVNDALRAEQRARPRPPDRRRRRGRRTLEVLSYAVLRLTPGHHFAGLGAARPGGVAGPSALPRARHPPGPARPRPGHRYARVDTTPASRPILTGLGMQAVADTRPYILEPPACPRRVRTP